MPASVTVKDKLLDIKEFVRLKKKILGTRAEMSGKEKRNNFYEPHPTSPHYFYNYLRHELIFKLTQAEFAVFRARFSCSEVLLFK